jgi:hypothetical protein
VTRHKTPTAYPRASTINGCQPPSLHWEAAEETNREGHGSLAGGRIVGGMQTTAQGPGVGQVGQLYFSSPIPRRCGQGPGQSGPQRRQNRTVEDATGESVQFFPHYGLVPLSIDPVRYLHLDLRRLARLGLPAAVRQEHVCPGVLGEYCQYQYRGKPLYWTVGNDSTFYRPPTAKQLRRYLSQIPEDFEKCCKVWEEITIPSYVLSDEEWGRLYDAARPHLELGDGLSVGAAIRGDHRVDVGQSGLEAGVYYFTRTRHQDQDGATSADDTRCESNTSRTSESAESGNTARLHLCGQTLQRITRAFQTALKDAGIVGFRFHDLRTVPQPTSDGQGWTQRRR